jgi:hypothetical protein
MFSTEADLKRWERKKQEAVCSSVQVAQARLSMGKTWCSHKTSYVSGFFERRLRLVFVARENGYSMITAFSASSHVF